MKILQTQDTKFVSGGGSRDDGTVWVPSPGGGPFDGEWRPLLRNPFVSDFTLAIMRNSSHGMVA